MATRSILSEMSFQTKSLGAIKDPFDDMVIKMPIQMTIGPYGHLRGNAYCHKMPAPQGGTPEPEPERANAEKYPVLAFSGFVFAEAIDLGQVVKPPCACPTCGRITDLVKI
jgi:hypothetical protein